MSHRFITFVSVFVALASLSLLAAEKHRGHTPSMDHSAMTFDGAHPQEGGQATFASIIEIVAMLERDTKTDWNHVDIDGLRAHLLDMNHLILETQATTTVLGNSQIRFDIRGTAASIPSIHRMVPPHSRFIEQSRGWNIQPKLNEDGATLTISVEDDVWVNRLSALGFYGFMSLDSHHQAHHYQMAIGNSH